MDYSFYNNGRFNTIGTLFCPIGTAPPSELFYKQENLLMTGFLQLFQFVNLGKILYDNLLIWISFFII